MKTFAEKSLNIQKVDLNNLLKRQKKNMFKVKKIRTHIIIPKFHPKKMYFLFFKKQFFWYCFLRLWNMFFCDLLKRKNNILKGHKNRIISSCTFFTSKSHIKKSKFKIIIKKIKTKTIVFIMFFVKKAQHFNFEDFLKKMSVFFSFEIWNLHDSICRLPMFLHIESQIWDNFWFYVWVLFPLPAMNKTSFHSKYIIIKSHDTSKKVV